MRKIRSLVNNYMLQNTLLYHVSGRSGGFGVFIRSHAKVNICRFFFLCVTFCRVFRAGEVTSKEATWVFKITHVSPEFRTYMFSCSSEREMKHWMKFFKQEMLRANGKLARYSIHWMITWKLLIAATR